MTLPTRLTLSFGKAVMRWAIGPGGGRYVSTVLEKCILHDSQHILSLSSPALMRLQRERSSSEGRPGSLGAPGTDPSDDIRLVSSTGPWYPCISVLGFFFG